MFSYISRQALRVRPTISQRTTITLWARTRGGCASPKVGGRIHCRRAQQRATSERLVLRTCWQRHFFPPGLYIAAVHRAQQKLPYILPSALNDVRQQDNLRSEEHTSEL